MLQDRYDNSLSTTSAEARDFYVAGVDGLLGAGPDMHEGLEAAVATDPNFALAHSGLARARQLSGNVNGAQEAMTAARGLAEGLTDRETSHLHALGLLIDGKAAEAYPAIRAHVAAYPRDVMVAQTCTSAFGLIAFSGQPGREAELLAYTSSLQPHYGDDWWFLGQHAFSLCETGRVSEASAWIERSLERNARNAHGAHARAHIWYEAGEPECGMDYLENWLPDYNREGLLHSHLAWHLALWKLGAGDVERMWSLLDDAIQPGASHAPAIIVMTDTAAMLYRAEPAGVDVPAERWHAVSEYAGRFFPNTGIAFADVHAALAHAMAGESAALEAIIANPAGPAADLVKELAEAYRAIARQDWAEATDHLTAAMSDHARIGGSRAQRDLLEHTLIAVLLRQDRGEEARRLLLLRRPTQVSHPPVAGL